MGEHQLGEFALPSCLHQALGWGVRWGDGGLSGSCTSSLVIQNDTDAEDLWGAIEGTGSLVDVELVYKMTT